MLWIPCDGGRAAAGFKGEAGDCVARSISIAAELPYMHVYQSLSLGLRSQRLTKRCPQRKMDASNGVTVKRKWFRDYMHRIGFYWTPTMGIGTGCRVHLRDGELPNGRLVVSVSKHYTAVIDGAIWDTYDCSRGGNRCVYGYWTKG